MMSAARALVAPRWIETYRQNLHSRLTDFNASRLKPVPSTADWQGDLQREAAMRLEEGRFVENERALLRGALLDLPTQPDEFMRWFEALKTTGPGQGDRLFPWLATTASMEQMRWFLSQEVAGEAGFDDLVALTQVRFPERPKLEMAANYWDEMGRGHARGMHGPMLARTVEELDLNPGAAGAVCEAVAMANLMAGLASNRRYAFQSVGALGVIEMTAPTRVGLVNEGLKRLGVSATGRQYFQLHAGLDIRHSEAWNREVIRPLVEENQEYAPPIAEGALLRLTFGQRCFERYRQELGVA
jgi:Iron-containing redox enzyme